LEYRVLGPLEVLDPSGRTLRLGGARQQSVLASLLLQPERTVALEQLIDALWEEEPPASAARTVQVYVARLRGELPEGAIQTRPGGYALRFKGDRLDLKAFEEGAEEGRAALVGGDSDRASLVLGEALRLWRGPALAGLPSEALRREAQRLEELRLQVLEDRLEADLASCRHNEVVAELQALVGEHPFRERLRAQLMLALYRSDRQTEALDAYQRARQALDRVGVEPSDALRRLQAAILRHEGALQPSQEASQRAAPPERRRSALGATSRTPMLDFAFDLTQSAREGRLDPVVGRAAEVEQTIEILCRRIHYNPVLIGEPGVGKTAIVEEVARWIATGKVPETLAEKRLVSLDLASIAAVSKSSTALEKRLGEAVNEIVQAGDVIFLDEWHGLVGAGAADGGDEAAHIVKRALRRGELQAIITMTLGENSGMVAGQEPWLERRFELVLVHEPTSPETIEILRSLRDRYERFHHVRISDEGIVAAVELADLYIVGGARPSKAIDLIDRASARARLRPEAGQLEPEVNAEQVADVLSREMGIPIS
jgi:ATP-dependent Clp protease ATP-binding subunit ClpA